MSKKIFGFVLFAVVVIAVVAFVAVGMKGSGEFHAVYLRTGDLYFGKLMRFPSFGLKQVYTFQVDDKNTETPLSVARFKKVFWGPEDYLQINRDEVVWMTRLDTQGQLAKLLRENPDLIPSQTGNNQQNIPQQGLQQLPQGDLNGAGE